MPPRVAERPNRWDLFNVKSTNSAPSEIHLIISMNQKPEEARVKLLRYAKTTREIMPLDDGFYYWWPESYRGAYAAYQLRWIADELDRLNEPYKKQINEYFEDNLAPPVELDEFTD